VNSKDLHLQFSLSFNGDSSFGSPRWEWHQPYLEDDDRKRPSIRRYWDKTSHQCRSSSVMGSNHIYWGSPLHEWSKDSISSPSLAQTGSKVQKFTDAINFWWILDESAIIDSDMEKISSLESETNWTTIDKVMFYSRQQRIQCTVQLRLSIALPIGRITHFFWQHRRWVQNSPESQRIQ
jgi:hypothetical protein